MMHSLTSFRCFCNVFHNSRWNGARGEMRRWRPDIICAGSITSRHHASFSPHLAMRPATAIFSSFRNWSSTGMFNGGIGCLFSAYIKTGLIVETKAATMMTIPEVNSPGTSNGGFHQAFFSSCRPCHLTSILFESHGLIKFIGQ